jgi:ABC-2 type transport system permease protein
MIAFIAITRVTIRQTLRPRRALGLALLSASTAVMYLLSTLGSRGVSSNPRLAFDNFVGMTIGTFMNIVVPVVTLIIATAVLGEERRDNTMSFLVLRPVSRFTIAAAKVTAAFAESFALTGLGAFLFGLAVAIRINSFEYLLPLLVGTVVTTAAYAAVFVPLGYLLKRATLIGLTYVFIWENGIGGAVPAVAGLSPWRVGLSAMSALAPERFLNELPTFATGTISPGAGGAAAKAIILVLLSAGAVATILRKRDLAT